jgi:thioredoxin reductase
MNNHPKVIIIGAGPAGISSCIQLKRYGIEPLLIEKNEVGGLLNNANFVENYLGFPAGITGRQLTELFKNQLKRSDIKIKYEKVLNVDYKDNFVVVTEESTYTSDYLIVASGTNPKTLPLLDNKKFSNDNIYYEIKNAPDMKHSQIAIIGAGDAAFDYAVNLSKNSKITILNKSSTVRCLPLLYDRVMKIKNIDYLDKTSVVNIEETNNTIILETNNQNFKIIKADYLFIAIGREPNLDFLGEGLVKLINKLENNKLFIIGDVKNGNYRQTSISTGDGIKAAMRLYKNTLEE